MGGFDGVVDLTSLKKMPLLDFNKLYHHIIPLDNFELYWRFNNKNYDLFCDVDLKKLKPLDKLASNFLWDIALKMNPDIEIPFKKNHFKIIKNKIIDYNHKDDLKTWLYECGVPSNQEVIVSWNSTISMILPWKILVEYFDSFYYTSSDDLTVFDKNLDWTILFAHYDEIYFGTNRL